LIFKYLKLFKNKKTYNKSPPRMNIQIRKEDQDKIFSRLPLNFDETKLSFREHIDEKLLSWIISKYTDYSSSFGLIKDWKTGLDLSIKQSLTKLKSYQKFTKVPQVYKHSKSSPNGRLFSERISLQGLPRKIRNTISREFYVDLDMKNAHMVLLCWYCKTIQLPPEYYKHILYYCENRDECLQELGEIYELNRDICKKIVLSICNGGYNTYEIDLTIEPTWLKNLRSNIKVIQKVVCELNPQIVKNVEKQKGQDYDNISGCVLNRVLCTYENIVLCWVIEYCFINKLEIGSLCFDGLLIKKEHYTPNLCKELNEWILKNTEIPIQMVQKEMVDIIDVENFEEKFQEQEFHLLYHFTHKNCGIVLRDYYKDEIVYTKTHNWVKMNQTTKIWSFGNDDNFKIESSFVLEEYILHLYERDFHKLQDDEEALKKFKSLYEKCKRELGNITFLKKVVESFKELVWKDTTFMDIFERKENLFVFKNGKCIDLDTGLLRDVQKEDYVLLSCGYDCFLDEKTEIDYTHIDHLLSSTFENEDQIKSFLSAMACSLFGRNKNELLFYLTGRGRNGKGVFCDVLQQTLGDYYGSIDIAQLTSYNKDPRRANSAIAQLQYKRCCMTTEPETDKDADTLKIGLIKKLTGNDEISCRFLNQNEFIYKPQFTMFLQCNDKPELSKTDDAIQRRLKIIEFPFQFVSNQNDIEEKYQKVGDTNLKNKVKTNKNYRDGFLMKMIQVYLETEGKFYETEQVKRETNEYFNSQNPVYNWLFENFDIDQNVSPKQRLDKNDLYNSFCYSNMKIPPKEFSKHLNKLVKPIPYEGYPKYPLKRKVQTEPLDKHKINLNNIL